jgi:hypothetical protein
MSIKSLGTPTSCSRLSLAPIADAGDAVDASRTRYDTTVIGVVSAQPGIMLGKAGDGKVLVAQPSRLRVKVDVPYGAVREGDLLITSSKPGVAMKSTPLNAGGATYRQSWALSFGMCDRLALSEIAPPSKPRCAVL